MLINFDKAPKEGVVLAYFRNCVKFQIYKDNQLEKDGKILGEDKEELLELHMFDENMEFRAVKSRSQKKYIPNDVLYNDNQDKIEEVILLEQKTPGKIRVVNYLSYDEYGMAKIAGYQLRWIRE
ncbi:hypothetical protein [[Clostridium] polysaccharolyticum]|uniref:Uncharacterized protein n=1 Tax=[Clostridium] polysaccharolyticum TaxID=29364 RepID=A0A1I0AUI5_9FIRM|nr:hypothetical protein [[Clostridium] polysaccharolyticum]SES98017.1 hypothetical protein SAMN04487772_10644 [[Clostridium] polysaccharolyticum]